MLLEESEAEEPEIKLPTSAGSWKKQESSRKTSISALLTMPKPLIVASVLNLLSSRLLMPEKISPCVFKPGEFRLAVTCSSVHS